MSGIMKLLISQNASPRTTAAAMRREFKQFVGDPVTKQTWVGQAPSDVIKERGGCVPPRKAQEGVLGRWDLAR
jgi:hypothetical protein